MSEDDPRGAAVKIRASTGDVNLIDVKVSIAEEGRLQLVPPKAEGKSAAISAPYIEFIAQVQVAETAANGDWNVGWIQTVYPSIHSVTYQHPSGDPRGKRIATIAVPLADGVMGDNGHWAWSDGIPDTLTAGQPATVRADDQPSVPFRQPYNYGEPSWVEGWNAVATSGHKIFGTWLVAETPDQEVEYLYHVAWNVDFGTILKNGEIESVTGQLAITSQGPGQGALVPVFCDQTINDADYEIPYLPDADLLKAKPGVPEGQQ
jgi:hypothetical protein